MMLVVYCLYYNKLYGYTEKMDAEMHQSKLLQASDWLSASTSRVFKARCQARSQL